jgi:hypothetical protein
LILGLAGGLLLGYVLSREGGWMTPMPWAIYLVALLAAIAVVSWLDERRRVRPVEAVGAVAAPTATVPANVVEFRREKPAGPVAAEESSGPAATQSTNDEGTTPSEAEPVPQNEVKRE